MKINFLSGGTGTPKLLQGFRSIIEDNKLQVISNNGDDIDWHGLRVCPDLDTLLYLFSGKLDLDKFWGVKDDSFDTIEMLRELGNDEWFSIGGKDLGLHIFRTEMLRIMSLSDVIASISDKWGIESTIVPMTDTLVQSQIVTSAGNLGFQEYFVKYKTKVKVKNVNYIGDRSSAPSKTLNLLNDKTRLIIGPSNPITSIGPILSIEPLRKKLSETRDNNIAVSPIIGDKAFSGPTVDLMRAKGLQPNPVGLARYYKDIISILILDETDRGFKSQIEDYNIEPVFFPILLKNRKQKEQLARGILNMI